MMASMRLDTGAEASRLGHRWLREMPGSVAPRYFARLTESLPLDPALLGDFAPEEDQTASGRVLATVSRWPRGRHMRTTVFSPRALDRAVDALADWPLSTVLLLAELDTGDVPINDGELRFEVRADEDDQGPVSVMLSGGDAPAGGVMDPDEAVFSAATDEVRRLCRDMDVDFAIVGDPWTSHAQTSLEEALGWHGLGLRPRDVLRGYSWVTVVAREPAARLGGADAMRASGAFSSVEELPHGGLWLQATERYEEYDRNAVERVFRAVAPILPDPRPENFELGEAPWYLVPESPVDYR